MINTKLSIITFIFLTIGTAGCAYNKTSDDVVTLKKPNLIKTEKEKWDLMIGKWYGKQQLYDGSFREQIAERHADGTYKIIFKYLDYRGNVKKTTEVGIWGISGPIYFSIYRGYQKGEKTYPSDPTDPRHYTAYEIIELNNNQFKYKSYSSGNIFTLIKVKDNYSFPE